MVKCSTTVSYGSQGLSVLLTKLKQGALSERDLPQGVIVSTVTQSPMFSLYHALKNVYPKACMQLQGGDNKKLQVITTDPVECATARRRIHVQFTLSALTYELESPFVPSTSTKPCLLSCWT